MVSSGHCCQEFVGTTTHSSPFCVHTNPSSTYSLTLLENVPPVMTFLSAASDLIIEISLDQNLFRQSPLWNI